jgi:hypothetical protein
LQFRVNLESLELGDLDEGKAWSMNFRSDELGELGVRA